MPAPRRRSTPEPVSAAGRSPFDRRRRHDAVRLWRPGSRVLHGRTGSKGWVWKSENRERMAKDGCSDARESVNGGRREGTTDTHLFPLMRSVRDRAVATRVSASMSCLRSPVTGNRTRPPASDHGPPPTAHRQPPTGNRPPAAAPHRRSARRRTSAGCSAPRPVPSAIWVRQLVPAATITVPGAAARTAGSTASSPMRIDTA